MKTPREFAAQWTELPMPARSSLEIATNNRDAKRRAELLKLQDDLLQGANREVMAEALIERLRGELEAVRLVCACGAFELANRASPPAESTPVLCEQHGREDCPRPDHAAPPDDIRERLDGLGRRISGLTADCDSDNRRIDDHERRLAALEANRESGTHCCVAERCTEWRLP